MVTFDPITEDGAASVTTRLRDADRVEAQASGDLYDHMAAQELGWRIASLANCGAVVAIDGRPAALIAVALVRPWIGEAAMLATDDWPRVGLSTTRWVKRELMPTCRRMGLTRVECRVMAAHRVARRWLHALGATEETELPGWGRNGEPFLLCSWS